MKAGMILLVGFSIALSACSIQRDKPVGVRYYHFTDTNRRCWISGSDSPRPLETLVWYPAKAGTKETSHNVAIFHTGIYAVNAPFAEGNTKYPLILLSHGTGGSAYSLAWFAEALARKGYIVAALNHHGNTGAEPKYLTQGFILWWERPQDIKVVLDKILEDETLKDKINTDRIGVAGFSLGGYTALSTVGARLAISGWASDPEKWANSPFGRLPPEASFSMEDAKKLIGTDSTVIESIKHADDSYLDPRIKVAFVMAPPLGPLLDQKSLKSIAVPVKILVGSRDDQAIPKDNAIPIANLIPGAMLEVLEGAGHYTFLCEGTFKGKLVDRTHLVDEHGVNRTEIHDHVGAEASAFFDKNLQ